MSITSPPEPILWKVEDVMRACHVGKHGALRLMHMAGPVRIDAHLRVRPEDIAAVLASHRDEWRNG